MQVTSQQYPWLATNVPFKPRLRQRYCLCRSDAPAARSAADKFRHFIAAFGPTDAAPGAVTNADAETPVSRDIIEWADVVLVTEKSHRKKVRMVLIYMNFVKTGTREHMQWPAKPLRALLADHTWRQAS